MPHLKSRSLSKSRSQSPRGLEGTRTIRGDSDDKEGPSWMPRLSIRRVYAVVSVTRARFSRSPGAYRGRSFLGGCSLPWLRLRSAPGSASAFGCVVLLPLSGYQKIKTTLSSWKYFRLQQTSFILVPIVPMFSCAGMAKVFRTYRLVTFS